LHITKPNGNRTITTMANWFNMESLKGLTDKVQKSIPKLDKEMLQKLTLTSPELTAERQRIDDEERRKENSRDMLADLLPWETHDSERDILVEECKEAILKLSAEKETFFGPYTMPKTAVKLTEKKKLTESEDDDEDANADDDDEEEEALANLKPSAESLEKLAKLEPLPPLLANFDLETHVGLIQKLLKVDPKLVEMQSKLSGTCVSSCIDTYIHSRTACSQPFSPDTMVQNSRWR
jgi:hypothetical protein